MYSVDLRKRVVEAVEGGMSRRAAARLYKVGESTAINWVSRFRRDGHIYRPDVGGDRRSGTIEAEQAWLLTRLRDEPDTTLEEYRSGLEERGVKVGIGTVWRFFDRHGISVKKNRARRRTGTP